MAEAPRRAMVAAGFVAFACAAAAHPPAILSPGSSAGVAKEIEDFRRAFAEAAARKDVAFLRRAYAESFTHTHTTTKIDGRDARIVAVIAGDPVIELAPVENLSISIHAGGWAAVATGVSPIRAADGKVFAVHWTSMYVRAGEDWQIGASHATRGKEIVK